MAEMPLTEYMKFNKPLYNYPNWDSFINANFDLAYTKFKEFYAEKEAFVKKINRKKINTQQNRRLHF